MKKIILPLMIAVVLVIIGSLCVCMMSYSTTRAFDVSSGNLVTCYALGGYTVYRTEKSTELSPVFKDLDIRLPKKELLIDGKRLFMRETFRTSRVFYDLKKYLLECKLDGKSLSRDEILKKINFVEKQ